VRDRDHIFSVIKGSIDDADIVSHRNFPLFTRFPALRRVPRVALCDLPSPVSRVEVDGTTLWIKRDDLNAAECGGNKARVLEFLLAEVRPGDTVFTVGGEGSTHVLATATHAARLGAKTIAFRWRHDMNPTADQMATHSSGRCFRSPVYATSVSAIARAQLFRLTHRVHYVPLGGSVPLGVLAQVNAALELADQIRAGELPAPARIVVPLGSGGTMAGFALGFAIAKVDVSVIGVQVAPMIVANRWRVRRLEAQTARLIERMTGERVPRAKAHQLGVARGVYGGAYGRPMPSTVAAAQRLTLASGILLDQTYSAKAFAVALEVARGDAGPTVFWNTFDGRLL
jgi:D-cysteine desulfhydrase